MGIRLEGATQLVSFLVISFGGPDELDMTVNGTCSRLIVVDVLGTTLYYRGIHTQFIGTL